MKCAECGTENARAVRVCAVCGAAPVGAPEASADQAEGGPGGYVAVAPTKERQAEWPRAWPDRWFLLLFLACCLLLVICAVVGSMVPPQSPWAGKVALTSGIIVCGAVTFLALFWQARRRIRLDRAVIGVRADDILKVLESRRLELAMSGDGAGADPWQDLYADGTAEDEPEWPVRPNPRRGRITRHLQDRRRLAQEHAGGWREFAQQPGTHLRLVRAGPARRDLRTAELQTVACIGTNLLRTTVSTGGKSYTQKRLPGPLRWALLDETGTAILSISGRHFNRVAGARITFPDQRWLQFPVRGFWQAHAIMTAVNQDGHKVARYRLNGGRRIFSMFWETVEITVHPWQPLTDELALAITISAPLLSSYFQVPQN